MRRRNLGELDQYYVEDHHEAIISREDYEAANDVIDRRRQEKGIELDNGKYQNRYPLSGKVICGECGGTFKRKTYTHKVVLACTQHIDDKEKCSMKYVDLEAVEVAFATMMNRLVYGRNKVLRPFYEALQQSNQTEALLKIHDIQEQLDALVEKKQTIKGLFAKGVIEPAVYTQSLNGVRDLFMRVQEEMVRRANLRSGEDGKKKRIYSSKYALSSLCTCEKCGDIYRRIAWNNRGKHSTVWRCCTRVEHGPGECDAPTIQETDLQAAVMKAINKVVGQKSTVIANLETILEQTVICADEELAELDEKIKAVQLELVDRATSSEGYEDLARESDRLNEEKQKILVTLAEDKGRQEKKAELIDFLHEQTTEFEKFDDGLVRRLIEQITVHESGTFTVEFKSGTMVEV